jgi:WD40 repeat protein
MDDGSIVRWTTEGEVIEDVWKGHEGTVESLSWYPGTGEYLASGSTDGTIIIRNTKSGEIDVGAIETDQEGVLTLAYSPLGDRLASGGCNICIWDTKTRERIIDPIEIILGHVTSVVWSSDSSKLYTTSDSDKSARVFDSRSGTELHHFEHDYPLYSVALSPKNDVLVCIGETIAQLWDIQSCKPLGQPFGHEDSLECVSFSRDGLFVASGEWGTVSANLTQWKVEDIAPELAVRAFATILQSHKFHNRKIGHSYQIHHLALKSVLSNSTVILTFLITASLQADATTHPSHAIGGDRFRDDPYSNFFQV